MTEPVQPKKLREKNLIDAFITLAPQFRGYQFAFYDENPDLVYTRDGRQLGFESILVLPTADSRCRLDPSTCSLQVPIDKPVDLTLADVQTELARTLFDHLRHYKLPTIIVFSLPFANIQLEQIAAHFRLPEVTGHNITDYYLASSKYYLKLAETGRW